MIRQTFLKDNVVEATRKRISWIFDEFENIVVSVSGGKDSTVLAHMCLQEAHKRGRRIGIFFLDEEVVYQSTVDQIRYIMNLYPENTIKMWYQIEFNLTNATSKNETQLKCWEKGKHKIWIAVRKKRIQLNSQVGMFLLRRSAIRKKVLDSMIAGLTIIKPHIRIQLSLLDFARLKAFIGGEQLLKTLPIRIVIGQLRNLIIRTTSILCTIGTSPTFGNIFTKTTCSIQRFTTTNTKKV